MTTMGCDGQLVSYRLLANLVDFDVVHARASLFLFGEYGFLQHFQNLSHAPYRRAADLQ